MRMWKRWIMTNLINKQKMLKVMQKWPKAMKHAKVRPATMKKRRHTGYNSKDNFQPAFCLKCAYVLKVWRVKCMKYNKKQSSVYSAQKLFRGLHYLEDTWEKLTKRPNVYKLWQNIFWEAVSEKARVEMSWRNCHRWWI